MSLLKWMIPICIGSIIFGNHYARDTVGALEKQIEMEFGLTTPDYATLNSLFFVPNMITPFIAGVVTKKLKPSLCLIYSCAIAGIGHFLFAYGAEIGSMSLLFTGRGLAGTMYEVVDSLPFIILAPHFSDNWSIIVGLLNGFLRLGSVLNFALCPVLYHASGVRIALWISAMIAMSGTIFAIASNALEIALLKTKDVFSSSSFSIMNTIEDIEFDGETSDEFKLDGCDEVSLRMSTFVSSASSTMDIRTLKDRNFTIENNDTSEATISFGERQVGPKGLTTDTDRELDSLDIDVTGISGLPPASTGNLCHVKLKWLQQVEEVLPLRQLSKQYYCYLITASCIYGAMVPFWFMGSKFLQDKYGLSVDYADALMLLPEGAIVLISPLMGYLLDRFAIKARTRFFMLAWVSALLPLAYVVLLMGYSVSGGEQTGDFETAGDGNQTTLVRRNIFVSPVIPMVLLGVGYACTNTLLWSCLTTVMKAEHMGISNGLVASCINVLPSAIPSFVIHAQGFLSRDEGVRSLLILSISGLAASVCSVATALLTSSAPPLPPLDSTPAYSDLPPPGDKPRKKSESETLFYEMREGDVENATGTVVPNFHTVKSPLYSWDEGAESKIAAEVQTEARDEAGETKNMIGDKASLSLGKLTLDSRSGSVHDADNLGLEYAEFSDAAVWTGRGNRKLTALTERRRFFGSDERTKYFKLNKDEGI